MISNLICFIKTWGKLKPKHYIVQDFIDRNWETPIYLEKYIGMSIRVWKVNKYYVIHTRQVRGDLIEVLTFDSECSNISQMINKYFAKQINYKMHMAYVNQSYQYGGFIGFNDVVVDDEFDITEFLS